MYRIPIQQVPSQMLRVTLNNQACRIAIYQKFYGIFVDLYVNDALIIGGVIAQDRNRIVRSDYLGFVGDLLFVDTQGLEDPEWDRLNDRYILIYATPSELAARGL